MSMKRIKETFSPQEFEQEYLQSPKPVGREAKKQEQWKSRKQKLADEFFPDERITYFKVNDGTDNIVPDKIVSHEAERRAFLEGYEIGFVDGRVREREENKSRHNRNPYRF